MSDATDAAESVSTDDEVRFLFARVGDRRIAVELGHLRRVVETPYEAVETTPVPRTPDTVRGVSRFQGDLAVIVDARELLEEVEPSGNGNRRLVLLTPPAGGELIGLLVDAVEGFETAPTSRLTAPDDDDGWEKAVLAPSGDDSRAGIVDVSGLVATVGPEPAR